MKPRILLFAAALMFVPVQAQSRDGGQWVTKFIGYSSDGTERYARFYCYDSGRCYRPKRTVRHYRTTPQTETYERERRVADDDRGTCRETRRAVGDQHLTMDGAKKAANDSWAGTVRFHLGEKYMDLANARHIVYTCSRSSIKEGGVTTLGQTLTRCEVEAQPCHPLRQLEANEK
jgi:hypothetical protein